MVAEITKQEDVKPNTGTTQEQKMMYDCWHGKTGQLEEQMAQNNSKCEEKLSKCEKSKLREFQINKLGRVSRNAVPTISTIIWCFNIYHI